jgi:hypothetical protein
MKPYCKKWWFWVLIVAVLVILWLLLAWLRAWFPFSHKAVLPTVPPVTQAEINSLTATGTPAVIPQSILDSLTAKPRK